MNRFPQTPLEHAKANREQIKAELAKSPDFQLYQLTRSAHDRARMERLLRQVPAFRLWRLLTQSIDRAEAGVRELAGSQSWRGA